MFTDADGCFVLGVEIYIWLLDTLVVVMYMYIYKYASDVEGGTVL